MTIQFYSIFLDQSCLSVSVSVFFLSFSFVSFSFVSLSFVSLSFVSFSFISCAFVCLSFVSFSFVSFSFASSYFFACLSQPLHLTSSKAFAIMAACLASSTWRCKVCLSFFALLFLSSCFALTFAKRRASQKKETVKRQTKGKPSGSAQRARLSLCHVGAFGLQGPHIFSPKLHAA